MKVKSENVNSRPILSFNIYVSSRPKEKARQVADELRSMKLQEAAQKLEDGIEETLTYMNSPYEHWIKSLTNNTIERLNREIKKSTKVVGAFPDGQSALMLVCARLRYVAGT